VIRTLLRHLLVNFLILVALLTASAILPFASLWLVRDPIGGQLYAVHDNQQLSEIAHVSRRALREKDSTGYEEMRPACVSRDCGSVKLS
jgi:hypothetical protein